MRDLVRSAAATAALAALIGLGYVFWLFDWDCCPHESGDSE